MSRDVEHLKCLIIKLSHSKTLRNWCQVILIDGNLNSNDNGIVGAHRIAIQVERALTYVKGS